MNNDLSMVERYLNSFTINVTNPTAASTTQSSNVATAGGGSDENSPPSSPNASNDTSSIPFFPIQVSKPSASSSQSLQQAKPPSSIYKISLDFLTQMGQKSNEKFRHQLCENSTRTIQREISNFSSQFLFANEDETSKQYSIYQKIISSNVNYLYFLTVYFINLNGRSFLFFY